VDSGSVTELDENVDGVSPNPKTVSRGGSKLKYLLDVRPGSATLILATSEVGNVFYRVDLTCHVRRVYYKGHIRQPTLSQPTTNPLSLPRVLPVVYWVAGHSYSEVQRQSWGVVVGVDDAIASAEVVGRWRRYWWRLNSRELADGQLYSFDHPPIFLS
jgi:hypothetical protein